MSVVQAAAGRVTTASRAAVETCQIEDATIVRASARVTGTADNDRREGRRTGSIEVVSATSSTPPKSRPIRVMLLPMGDGTSQTTTTVPA